MKKIANCEIRNLFSTFSLRVARSDKLGLAIVAGRRHFLAEAALAVVLGSFFALSTPSLALPVDKLAVAAIDDVVAGDEGWIIAIDDVAADAGGWITAVDNVTASAGGGIAAYAAEAGGGFAAFGNVASEVGGGIAAFGKVEKELANIAVGVETSINNVTAGGGFEFDSTADDSEPIDDDISVVIIDPEKETPREDGNTIVGIGRLFDENGRELFPEDFNINNPATDPGDKTPSSDKTPTSKPDERTTEFPSNNNTPQIIDDPVDETLVVDKPDEDTAIDDTAIYPNGEPPSSDNTPTIINDLSHPFAKIADSVDNKYKNWAKVFKTNEISIEAKTNNDDIDINISRSKVNDTTFDDVIRKRVAGRGNRINIKIYDNDLFEDYEMIKGVDIAIQAIQRDKYGFINILNRGKISDVRQVIHAELENDGFIVINNRGEIWNVREYGIYAYHKGKGSITVQIKEDIKRILEEDKKYSDVYMRGGDTHILRLNQGIILDNVTLGIDGDGRIESWWDVDSGNTQTQTFEGFIDNGAYRYVLENFAPKGWQYYRVLTPIAKRLAEKVKDLTNLKVDGTPVDNFGFYVHQNSLRSSDDSVHFGFNTPVMSFIGGDLSINNNIAPNLSASLVEGMSISNSIGLDYHFDIMSFSVSPQIDLAWTRFDFDDFTGPGSTGKVSLEDGDVITSRLGLSFNGDYIYGGVNLHAPIDGKTSVNISGASIASEQDDFSVDGLLGFSYDWSENYWTYGEVFMSSRDGAEEVRANLGMRIEF